MVSTALHPEGLRLDAADRLAASSGVSSPGDATPSKTEGALQGSVGSDGQEGVSIWSQNCEGANEGAPSTLWYDGMCDQDWLELWLKTSATSFEVAHGVWPSTSVCSE